MQLPQEFVDRAVLDLGGAEARALCEALDGPPCVSVRYNPAKRAELPAGDPVPWCEWGRYLAERPPFTLDPAFHAGCYYVQEASSQFVGRLLEGCVHPGMRVLDLCAAPGGKTTLYASLAGAGGLVVANEISRQRAAVLADNVRKWGTGNVVVTSNDPQQVAALECRFDAVAVDAPCSGEGMFRRLPEARGEWSPGAPALCARRQGEILDAAWRTLRPGGRLIYSTCTFNREEDEGVLEAFCARVGGEIETAEQVACDPAWGVVEGDAGAFQTFRFYPHRARGEGFFAAVACKSPDVPGRERRLRGRRTPFAAADRQTAAEAARWVLHPERMRFALVGDTCYGYDAGCFEEVKTISETLTAIYSGVAVGQMFRGVLKPDPALAFFAELDRRAVPVTELDTGAALDYLRKRAVAADGLAEGMNLLTAGGDALGFAKRIGGRVNNLYPNSLRIINQ